MRIRDEILSILAMCLIEENVVYLPKVQLERKAYLEVNKHLEHLGGKWNRKAKGHIFDSDPADSFENMLLTGETTDFKKELQFFETPINLAKMMVEMLELETSEYVREPSAGKGAIVKAIKEYEKENDLVLGYRITEIAETYWKYLVREYEKDVNTDVCWYDFLKTDSRIANKIIMNPPFTKQQDIDHILHAYSLLNPGGILVSVVSEAPFFRENKKSTDFRQFLHYNDAEIIKNPEGTFKASGTRVKTRLIKIKKTS